MLQQQGGYTEKRITSGDMLEIDIFPTWKRGRGSRCRGCESSEIQKVLNEKNRKRRAQQLINANFTKADVWITVTYRGRKAPTVEQFNKDVKRYIRKLKSVMAKLTDKQFKYFMVKEYSETIRPHAHIVTNFPDRDLMEEMWEHGDYPQAQRLKPYDFGLNGLASYLMKDPRGKKAYSGSRNLVKPWKYAKYNHSRYQRGRAVRKLLTQFLDPKEHFEKVHKGYKLIEFRAETSDWGGIFLYAVMYRRG